MDVTGLTLEILAAAWHVLEDSSVFLLFGFLLAGVIKVAMPMGFVERGLGGRSVRSVLRAALIGVPLPLCSCSVVPTAIALRKEGAGKGATSAFLVSTPETGVDSISVSYALLDPVMTVFRPFAAFITAVVAGVMEIAAGKETDMPNDALACEDECCSNECGTGREPANGQRVFDGLRYAYVELMDDLAGWMVIGFLASGVIMVAIPDGFFTGALSGGLPAMLLMLIVGVPMYICATSSTPIAAAMILKGLSPGAALVFLLAGPATNIGTIMLLRKFMGARSVWIYLASIAITSIALGYSLDGLYQWFSIDPHTVMGKAAEIFPESAERAAAVVFAVLAARSVAAVNLAPALARLSHSRQE